MKILLLLSLFAPFSFAQSFLPENKMKIPVGENSGISEKDFFETINDLEKSYSPIVTERGAKLLVVKDWANATVNAFADQGGGIWKISLFGGLARHKTITKDGFALVVCHELGHHLGGAPKSYIGWASNEGQSDYFATTKCLRRYWENQDHTPYLGQVDAHPAMKAACLKTTEPKLCMRLSLAGLSAANLFDALGWNWGKPEFDRPDRKEVKKTSDDHPKAQCRLDTYFQGALCEVSYDQEFSHEDEVSGACHSRSGHQLGMRPRCWFKPQI